MTIVPVVEEVVVVQRKLVLKEELRIRRVRTTEQHRETVTLRRHEAATTARTCPPTCPPSRNASRARPFWLIRSPGSAPAGRAGQGLRMPHPGGWHP